MDLKVVLSYTFLMARDIEHFLKCLLAICKYSFDNYLFGSLTHRLISRFILCNFEDKDRLIVR